VHCLLGGEPVRTFGQCRGRQLKAWLSPGRFCTHALSCPLPAPDQAAAARRAAGGVWLAPTRLAQALASGGAGEAAGEVSDGFIVVETNYRVRPGARLLVPPDHACRLHRGTMSLFCACGLAGTPDQGHARWQMHWQARWRLPRLCSVPRRAPAHTRPYLPAPACTQPHPPAPSHQLSRLVSCNTAGPTEPAPRSWKKVNIAQVYAYTSSALQAAILRLFVRCECVLPNLFVGVLTRESVTGALGCGLAADQIVDFLRKHAHPHVAQRVPIVPEARARATVAGGQGERRLQAVWSGWLVHCAHCLPVYWQRARLH